MNEQFSYKNFNYNLICFNKYYLTDHSKIPAKFHYFGCIIKGTAKIKTQKTELLLNPYEIFYIPKGLQYQSHWFGENGNEIKFYSFGFKNSPINKSFVLQKLNCSDKAKEVFNELCEEIPFTEKGIGKLYYFFGLVSDDMKESKKSQINPLLEKVTEYIINNPNDKISDIAKFCNMSEPSIFSLFKKHLDKTPNQFRNEILCEKAVSLLTTTNKSVQEISDTLNFSSTSYFRKILKAHTGKTPLEIRKKSDF